MKTWQTALALVVALAASSPAQAADFSGKNKNTYVDPQNRDFNEPKEPMS